MFILLTGGGTGGHFYPLMAVAQELKRLGGNSLKIKYLGARHPLNREMENIGIPTWTVASSKFRRYFSFLNILDFFKFFWSVSQSFIKLFILMPDLVFSKGGPGALPVILAARFYRIPVYIHESDAVPGLTNKISSRFAKKIFSSFETIKNYFPTSKNILTGNPIRSDILELVEKESRETAKAKLGIPPQNKLIFVLGGSQGAVRINDFILENIKEFAKMGWIFHQVGAKNIPYVEGVVKNLKIAAPDILGQYKWAGFLSAQEMSRALTAADMVITRAGASSIFEIAAFGKPSILIPLEGAAGDHQTENAYQYEKGGACMVIEEPNLIPGIVIQRTRELLNDPQKLVAMSQAAKSFARPEAAKKIAEEILRT